jgi:hypothetical protein
LNKLIAHPSIDVHAFSFEAVWNHEEEEVITRSRTSDVCLIHWIVNNESTSFYRKRYWYPKWKDQRKGFFRNTFFGRSRARAEFHNLSKLSGAGLSKVKPVLLGEDRRLRLLRRSFIVTECIARTDSLTDYLNSKAFMELSMEQRRLFLAALGRWASRLHNRGYKDRDFFARNILVHPADHEWCFSKIDSSASTWGGDEPVTSSPYIQDLKDLDGDLKGLLSRADRLRALLAYLGAGDPDPTVRQVANRILS